MSPPTRTATTTPESDPVIINEDWNSLTLQSLLERMPAIMAFMRREQGLASPILSLPRLPSPTPLPQLPSSFLPPPQTSLPEGPRGATSSPRPPPDFPSAPAHTSPSVFLTHSSLVPPGLPIPDNYILTNRPAPTRRLHKVVQLYAASTTPGQLATRFLLCNAENGSLWHGTAPTSVDFFALFLAEGIEVIDFQVANKPIMGVGYHLFFIMFDGMRMMRYIGPTDANGIETIWYNFLREREFMRWDNVAARWLNNAVEVGERLARRPHRHVAEYKGALVDDFNRVNCVVYKQYEWSLRRFAEEGRLERWHRRIIVEKLELAFKHLHDLRITYGNVKPENVYVTFKSTPLCNIAVVMDVVLGQMSGAMGHPHDAPADWRPFSDGIERDVRALDELETWIGSATEHP